MPLLTLNEFEVSLLLNRKQNWFYSLPVVIMHVFAGFKVQTTAISSFASLSYMDRILGSIDL